MGLDLDPSARGIDFPIRWDLDFEDDDGICQL